MARINIGNAAVSGFVNLIQDNRIVIGTGSYKDKSGNTVFKESITIFLDQNFDGEVVDGKLQVNRVDPSTGQKEVISTKDYLSISADLVVATRKDNADKLSGTMNVRFLNQIVKSKPGRKKEEVTAETAFADDDI